MRITSKNRSTVIAWLATGLLTVMMYVLYLAYRSPQYETPYPELRMNWIW